MSRFDKPHPKTDPRRSVQWKDPMTKSYFKIFKHHNDALLKKLVITYFEMSRSMIDARTPVDIMF